MTTATAATACRRSPASQPQPRPAEGAGNRAPAGCDAPSRPSARALQRQLLRQRRRAALHHPQGPPPRRRSCGARPGGRRGHDLVACPDRQKTARVVACRGNGAAAIYPRTTRRLATDRTARASAYVQTQPARPMLVTAGGPAAAGRPTETARATFFGHRTPGGGRSGWRRCFHHDTIDRISPCSIVDPKNPGSPSRGFFHWEP